MLGSTKRKLYVSVPVAIGLSLLLAAPQANAALPSTGSFPKSIDGYAPWNSEAGCHVEPLPGTKALGNLMNSNFPGHTIYYRRACGSAGTSSHEIGRAIDFMVQGTKERDDADAFLGWLLKTDKHGNKHAMARRLGVMYVIYNRKIWKAYDERRWVGYGGNNPHTDHIHISLSKAGANKSTSFWKYVGTPSHSSPASAARVRICNSTQSEAEGKLNDMAKSVIYGQYGDDDRMRMLFPGDCYETIPNTSDLRINIARAPSWRIRTTGGDYGPCHDGQWFNPNGESGYVFRIYPQRDCKG